MAYISYDELWRNEFYNNVSSKDSVQDINFDQIKLKVMMIIKKMKKIVSKFEPFNPENSMNKVYLDTN